MNIGLIYEYESILLGNRTSFSLCFFNQTPDINEKMAISVLKYAVETYLMWTPEKTIKCLDKKAIKLLKLEQVIKYIQFPAETDPSRDLYIVGLKMYPNYTNINIQNTTLIIYERLLSGKLKKFPKEYMVGNIGNLRAMICFQYILSNYLAYMSIEELYCLFASPKGRNVLKKYKINAICTAMYKYPIDFLHDSLPNNMKNNFYYRYYKFDLVNREQIRKIKKEEDSLIL